MNKLYELMDKSRIPYFLCVGTTRHQVDGVSVMIGDYLKSMKCMVLGTTGDELNGVTIPMLYEDVISKIDSRIYQLICIDTATGGGKEPYVVSATGLRPGAAVGKNLPTFGEITIHINVEYFIPSFQRMFALFIPSSNAYIEPVKKMTAITLSMIKTAIAYVNDKAELRERDAIRCADLIINQNMTIREVARYIGKSKSYTHVRLTHTLPELNVHLANAVAEKLEENFKAKYLKGGETTKLRYTGIKRNVWQTVR